MATRYIVDQENSNAQGIKARLQSSSCISNPNRAALGEVGNKIQTNAVKNQTRSNNLMKPPTTNVIVKKTTTVVVKKTTGADLKTTITNNKTVGAINDSKLTHKKELDNTLRERPLKLLSRPSLKESLSYSSNQLKDILNVDRYDDPLLVSEYIQDIFDYLLTLEDKYKIRQNFLDEHKSTPRMRSVLVNWMVEVHISYKLLLETLHLSVAIVDSFLQLNKEVGREALQLVGTTAMWIAGKYEEIYVPELKDFVYICDDAFSKKQIKEMELNILKKLDFNMGKPLSIHFLRRYNRIANVTAEHHVLGKYFLELMLLDYELCQVKPSLQAAAACCFSISILNGLINPCQAWTDILVHYSKYTYLDIKPVIVSIARLLNSLETSKYQSICNKYSDAKYLKISLNSKLKGTLVKRLVQLSTLKK